MATKVAIYNAEDFRKSIYITDHAHKRWKQRVGRLTKSGIANYIRNSAKTNKVEHYWDKFYIIDNDIVVRADAKYDADKKIKSITIVTAFGRISENPALNNLPVIVKEKHKYGKMLKKRKDLIS